MGLEMKLYNHGSNITSMSYVPDKEGRIDVLWVGTYPCNTYCWIVSDFEVVFV